ncbi:MAG: TIGR03435 family protein [Candidatus Acidiferrales bacterium]
MTPAIGHAIFAISDSFAASIIVKATIVISIALIAAYFARHSRASVRHAILAAGFGVLLALPIAAIIAPPLHIALPIAQGSSTLATNPVQSFDETSLVPRAATNAPSSAQSETTSFSLFDLVFALWAIGAAIFLAPVIIGLWQVRSLRRTALPWPHGNSVASAIANELKISRGIEVLLHEAVAGPMTCGIFHPAIVFPVQAENWDDADLNRAIAHELEHVRRADWLTHCLARIVCAAYWFHPVVWIAWRQLTLEAERACDDAVLAHSEATAYAEQLVALARQLTAANKSPLLAMASRSDLTARVTALLDKRQHRGRAGFFTFAIGGIVTALSVLTISPLKLTAAQPGGRANRASLTSFEVASVKPHKRGDREMFPEFLAGGRFTEAGVPLRLVIAVAYNIPVQGTQLSGGPDWIGTNDEAYDIEAKAQDGALKGLSEKARNQKMRLMLQALLADRFKLVMHRDMKEQPVYMLTVPKNGPKLQKSKLAQEACADLITLCGTGGVGQGRGIHLKATTITDMVFELNNFTDRPLLDRTGLTDLYDIDTDGWVPMRDDLRPTPQRPMSREAEALADPNRPTLSMILSELGLKMEPSQAMVESFTIEHVERPTPN